MKAVKTDRPKLPRFIELVRVSSKGQHDRDTPEIQRGALDKLRESRPGVFIERIEHTTGISGALGVSDRPDLQRLARLAGARAFDELRVFKIDRLTRASDERERFAIFGFAKDAGAVFIDCGGTEIDPQTQVGSIQWFFGTMATAEELAKIRERTHGGRLKAAMLGGKYSGSTPYGLTYERKTKTWGIDEAKAPTVRRIFELTASGSSMSEIAAILNAEHVPGPRTTWKLPSIESVLRQTAYYGEIRYGDQEFVVRVPAILDRSLWDVARAKLRARKSVGIRPTKREALLRRVAVCGLCGSSMSIDQSVHPKYRRRYLYYRCYSKERVKRGGGGPVCEHAKHGHPVETVDVAVWNRLRDVLRDPERLASGAGQNAGGDSWQAQMDSCGAKLAKIKAEETATLRMLSKGLAPEACEERLSELKRERERTQGFYDAAKRQATAAKGLKAAAKSLQERLGTITDKLDAEDFETRRSVILSIIPDSGGVVFYPDDRIEVRCLIHLPNADPVPVAFEVMAA
jgi:site-specific DNA recombinase